MNTSIPSAEQVRQRLQSLSHAGMRKLALEAGVPFTTLWKVRTGETRNPGVETVRQFWHLIWPELIGTEGAPPVPQQQEVRDAA